MTIDAVRAGYRVREVELDLEHRATGRSLGGFLHRGRQLATSPAPTSRAVSLPAVILAIDQGTTGTTCLVFDREGRIVGRAYSEFEQHFPRPGWVEHDANEIWQVTRRVAAEALADAGIRGADLDAIGITNQRETVVAWDPRHRRAGPPRAGLAGPAHGRPLRRAAGRPATRSWCGSEPGS